ncbi:uncharacterized protein LOC106163118 [Lingula anatina]|uniref:Uncharacterized protein LOC106163118 n=1 Tax=Lingula anatina TaxID=7574 RepID=A0A1S3IF52_LINAN|nr:uncharacterized protein LOC106163118 [Lingula anatina]|eukprot:XP_013396084.1 uncharacterized protein LOC106163118 [Lingula anatina]
MAAEGDYLIVPREEVTAFAVRCLTAVGSRQEYADTTADLLTAADYRGHFSHGLNRLEMYVDDIICGTTDKDAVPTIENETAATAWVNGNNAPGPPVAKFCMDLAIRKAKEAGIAMVAVKESNHFGIAGWYSMRACEQGLIGLAFTNSSPAIVPTRAKKPTFGTNPISMAAPAENGDSFVLDMATSTVAMGKVEIAERRGHKIPDGWGVDKEGKVTNDPTAVIKPGGLLPLGGAEETSGYKGYGLALMVEVLCGITSGAYYGPNIRKWQSQGAQANLGQCFIAIDPNVFAPGFSGRMSDIMSICRQLQPVSKSATAPIKQFTYVTFTLYTSRKNRNGQCFIAIDPNVFAPGFSGRMSDIMSICRQLQPATEDKPVLVAGDPERLHMEKCDAQGGIEYHPNQIEFLNTVADKVKVAHIKPLR